MQTRTRGAAVYIQPESEQGPEQGLKRPSSPSPSPRVLFLFHAPLFSARPVWFFFRVFFSPTGHVGHRAKSTDHRAEAPTDALLSDLARLLYTRSR